MVNGVNVVNGVRGQHTNDLAVSKTCQRRKPTRNKRLNGFKKLDFYHNSLIHNLPQVYWEKWIRQGTSFDLNEQRVGVSGLYKDTNFRDTARALLLILTN